MKKYKIFLVLSGQATSLKGSKIWLRNFYDPLIKLGHTVELFDIDSFVLKKGANPFSQKAKNILSNELISEFQNAKKKTCFDIFFSYLHEGQIEPAAVKDISKSVFFINYTTNYHQFSMYKEIAKYANLNIYISKIAKEGFDKIGASSYYMPLAANPDFYKPSKNKTKDIVFVGSTYGFRPYYNWRILQSGVDLKIYGPGWKAKNNGKTILRDFERMTKYFFLNREEKIRILDERMRMNILFEINKNYKSSVFEPLSDDRFIERLATASIVVNVNESRYNHDYYNPKVLFGCNLREFETTMSGTFSLTQYSDELEDFFVDGEEVVSFKNEHELIDKLKYYTSHTEEIEKIASQGYLRALKDHTWQNRFNKLFNENKIY